MMRASNVIISVLVALLHLESSALAYRDVVIVHGVLSNKYSLNFLSEYIRQSHPGTRVYNLNLYPGIYSLERMWKQVADFGKLIELIGHKSGGRGLNLIGYSQGGLVARGVLQSWDNHTVNTFISLSAPQAGQFGNGFLHLIDPSLIRNEAYRIFYTRYGQKVSVANYWNDPRQQNLFRSTSEFLAPINNDLYSRDSQRFRNNMLRLKKLVLIGGPDDGVIGPWQSAHFGFYNSNMTVIPLMIRNIYLKDSIGLKELSMRNALVEKTFSGVQHHHWHHNLSVIDDAILPYLD